MFKSILLALIFLEYATNAEWHTIKYCTLPKTNGCFQTYQVKKVYVETLFSTSYGLLTNRRPFGSYLFLLTCEALYFKCQIFWKATKKGMCYMHGIYVIVGFFSFFLCVLCKEFSVSVCFTWAFGDFSVSWLPDGFMRFEDGRLNRDVCLLALRRKLYSNEESYFLKWDDISTQIKTFSFRWK